MILFTFTLTPSHWGGMPPLEGMAISPHLFHSFEWAPGGESITAGTAGGTFFTLRAAADGESIRATTSMPGLVAVDVETLQSGLRGVLNAAISPSLFSITGSSVTEPDAEPDVDRGLRCSKCGDPVPDPTPEMEALARRLGAPLAIDHAVCPSDEVPPGRQFAVVVSVVDAGDDTATNPYFRFTHTVEATTLDAAMRPLAEGLGQKWMAAEKQASVADGTVS